MWKYLVVFSCVLGLSACTQQQAPAKVVMVQPDIKRVAPKKTKKGQSKQAAAQTSKNNTRNKIKESTSITWGWPVQGTILSRFQPGKSTFKGIDVGGTAGTPILAAADGEVVYSGNSLRGYGNLIIIKHKNNFLSAYAHNRKNAVKEGDRVTLGQRIAEMGQTGTDKVKLHFEVRYHGKPIDPQGVLPTR